MKYFEDKLEALDAYFAPKKESEKWLIILGIAGFIAYIGYDQLLPYTEAMYKKSESSKQSIEKSIVDNTTYLNSITVGGNREYYVTKYNNDIVEKNNNIKSLNDKIDFIDISLSKLSDMLFNQKSWSTFLNSITGKAEIQNVHLLYITNKYVDNNGSFGHVLEVVVGCKGEYKNTIKFINEIEQNVLVTDVFETEFTPDTNSSDVIADIHISVWGINH
jgi:hypothetical protein